MATAIERNSYTVPEPEPVDGTGRNMTDVIATLPEPVLTVGRRRSLELAEKNIIAALLMDDGLRYNHGELDPAERAIVLMISKALEARRKISRLNSPVLINAIPGASEEQLRELFEQTGMGELLDAFVRLK